MFLKHIIIAALMSVPCTSFLYGMNHPNNDHDIEMGFPQNYVDPNHNSGLNLVQRISELKGKVTNFKRCSFIVGISADMYVTGASYVCTLFAATYKSSPLLWTAYGLFMGSILIKINQGCLIDNLRGELLSMINGIEHSL